MASESGHMEFECVDPDDTIYADLSSRFQAYNAANSTWDPKSFSIIKRSGDCIVAGGRGIINLGALEIRGLWVDEDLRGTGLGKALMDEIEREGQRRGARRAMLYTFSWQAQAFYERCGYAVYARFDYPDGFQRIDLMKDL